MELEIYWFPPKFQCVLALVDTGAKCSLIYSNPERFPGLVMYVDSYEGKTIKTKAGTIP